MVEPDVIGTDDRPPRRRPGWALPVAALVAAGLAGAVISLNSRQPAPRPIPPMPSPTSTTIDFDTLVLSGPCIGISRTDRELKYLFGIDNSGHQPLDILSLGRPAAGLQLIATRLPSSCDVNRPAPPFSPFQLEPGESRLVLLRFRITSCAAARSSARVPVTVSVGYLNRSVRKSLIDLPADASAPCG